MLGALPTGPVPFDSSSNAAALAMATALQTAQKPAGKIKLKYGFRALCSMSPTACCKDILSDSSVA